MSKMFLDELFLDNVTPEISLDMWNPLLSGKVKTVRMVPEKLKKRYFANQVVSKIMPNPIFSVFHVKSFRLVYNSKYLRWK